MSETQESPRKREGKAGYSNFKDPAGLFLRMLKSGNKAAYFTLFREGLALLLTPLDHLLAPLERRRLRRRLRSGLPVVLILGGSRSGTTLLYQVLSQYLPVSYFNNLSASFPRAPITAGRFFNKLLKKKRGSFQNFYGSVAGFNGPNDGFHIWNRWFGENRNVVQENLDDELLDDMRNFLHTWNASFNRPLLNKNNRNSLAVPHFEAALPGRMYYIIIRRDPVYVTQSLIQSREIVQGDKRIAWGLGAMDREGEAADPFAYIDDISRQVFEVEQQITDSMNEVDPDRYIEVSYEDFCEDPCELVQQVAGLIFGKRIRGEKLQGLEPFKNTNYQRLEDEEFDRVKKHIRQLFAPNMKEE